MNGLLARLKRLELALAAVPLAILVMTIVLTAHTAKKTLAFHHYDDKRWPPADGMINVGDVIAGFGGGVILTSCTPP
jgi:hypothetical protein